MPACTSKCLPVESSTRHGCSSDGLASFIPLCDGKVQCDPKTSATEMLARLLPYPFPLLPICLRKYKLDEQTWTEMKENQRRFSHLFLFRSVRACLSCSFVRCVALGLVLVFYICNFQWIEREKMANLVCVCRTHTVEKTPQPNDMRAFLVAYDWYSHKFVLYFYLLAQRTSWRVWDHSSNVRDVLYGCGGPHLCDRKRSHSQTIYRSWLNQWEHEHRNFTNRSEIYC